MSAPMTREAAASRACARLGLTVAIGAGILTYFAFAGFAPWALAVPAVVGGTMTLWFPLGWALIAASVAFAALYVRHANRAEDALRAAKRTAPALVAPLLLAAPAKAATGAGAGPNLAAIGMFLALVAGTLAITWWAARRTRSAAQFYAGDGQLTAFQNGLAIAGDTLSAGAFLGLSGLVFGNGFDGLVYAVGYSVGYPVIALLFADRMRRLGRFTFADVVSYRLGETPVRSFAIASTLTIVIFYLIAQMVGAGQLIQLLFGLDYIWAEAIVGGLMICYVLFGGMTATSWVQIVKAVLMLAAGIAIALLARFGFDFGALLAEAVRLHPKHEAILAPSSFALMPVSALSLALAQLCGSAGLPHVIMRFFTVSDARTARVTMLWGSVFIGFFFALVFIIGFGTVALVRGNPAYTDAAGAPIGGGNMAAVHLAHAVGSDLMLGLVAAVAFATILAVVAGLTLSGASAISHDLYASVLRRGQADSAAEMRISRIAVLVLGGLAVALGIAFRHQNVAYMIALVVGIAASSNLPLLLLAIYWRRGLTTAGAVAGGVVGLASAILLTVGGPSVWVKVLGHAAPLFPLDPPPLVTMPLAFATCIAVSLLDRSRRAAQDRAGFETQSARMAGILPAAAE